MTASQFPLQPIERCPRPATHEIFDDVAERFRKCCAFHADLIERVKDCGPRFYGHHPEPLRRTFDRYGKDFRCIFDASFVDG